MHLRSHHPLALFLAALCLLLCPAAAACQGVTVSHALSIAGAPKYGPDFTHFDYVNPDAPKGGELRRYATGRFNNFNPFANKGRPAAGFHALDDTLMVTAEDDPYTLYGLIANSVEYPEDRSWIVFHLDPRAKFHDGHPITAEDVVFSYEALGKSFGNMFRSFFQHVQAVTAVGEQTVRVDFKPGASRKLPSIIAQLTIYPKHYWEQFELDKTTLTPPLGSGPYRLKSFKPGREVIYERVKDYWAADLPVRRGQNNFDILRYDYFQDGTVALEAFKAGLYDIRQEGSAKNWTTLYTGPAFESGEIRKEAIRHEQPMGIQGFFFNVRRPLFQDIRVRRALMLAFDYNWVNRKLYFDQYPRNDSYFTNSDLASRGVPEGAELALLEPFREQLPAALFTQPYVFPKTPGDGFNRANLLQAAGLLAEAGYILEDGVLVNGTTREPFVFRLLTDSTSIRRVALPFARALKRLGIELQIYLADSPQFIRRMRDHDYDMISSAYGQQLIPGREQLLYWHSSSADMEGGRNLIGVARPEVDSLVEALAHAPTQAATIAAGRALDRVLLWSDYVIPLGSSPFYRVAWWDRFGRPAERPGFGLALQCWWEEKPLSHPTASGE